MLSKGHSDSQLSFYSTFEEQLSHRHPLYILANEIDWNLFEDSFTKSLSPQSLPPRGLCRKQTIG